MENPQTKREVLNEHGEAINNLVEKKWADSMSDEEYLQGIANQRAETLSKLERLQEP